MEKKSILLPVLIGALLIAGGLVCSAFIIAEVVKRERVVDVKGFSERVVKADLASWQIPYRASADTLELAVKAAEESQKKIVDFITANGFSAEEIEMNPIKITDKNSDPYAQNIATTNRFVVEGKVSLRSNKVDPMLVLSQKTLDLAKNGVVLVGDYYSSAPQYEFTGLTKLKPEMIAEATKDARRAAGQFAKDSGADVGAIKYAEQGYFSIEPVDQVSGTASVMKKVRVVSTVQFYIQ